MRIPLLLMTCILCSAGVSTEGAQFKREDDFGPVRLTVQQAVELANEVFTYVESVNSQESKTAGSVEFESPRYTAKLDLPLTEEEVRRIPDTSFAMRLSIGASRGNISYAFLSLGDGHRSLTVEGNSYEHVTGLVSVVGDKVRVYGVRLGGTGQRSMLGALVVVVFMCACGVVASRFQNPVVWGVTVLAMVVAPNAIIWLFPWTHALPGTLIVKTESSFLIANAPLFTFLGLMAGLAGIILQSIMTRADKKVHATT